MNWALGFQFLGPWVAALVLLGLPSKYCRAHRAVSLIVLASWFVAGWFPVNRSTSWVHAFHGDPDPVFLSLGQTTFSISLNPYSGGLAFSLFVLFFSVLAFHPFHTKEKIKPFVATALLIFGCVWAALAVDHQPLALTAIFTTSFLFWYLMTQMGTGSRSLTALRVFALFTVFDTFALGYWLAPSAIMNFLPAPWAIALGTLLPCWLRLGIFPFHSVFRWVSRSISPSVVLLFVFTQFILAVRMAPGTGLNPAAVQPAVPLQPALLWVHFLWLGLLSIGERRPMMIYCHGVLLLGGFALLVSNQLQHAFSFVSPWPWALGLLISLGLFVDELHNLKNDVLASFEVSQIGLLRRWPQMHGFAQVQIFSFVGLLLVIPLWVLWLPDHPYWSKPNAISWHLRETFALGGTFCLALLATHVAMLQLWKRWNRPAPVERVQLPQGAHPPVMWRWHLSSALGVGLFVFGLLLHLSIQDRA